MLNDVPSQLLSVSLFSEVYTPIVNGVVASIEGLRAGLVARGIETTIVAPSFPAAHAHESGIVRLPSLPLPTSSGYRLCIPSIGRDARVRIARAAIVHVHSPFVTGLLGVNIARRSGVPVVYTYHTRLDAYAHYAPLEPRIARAALIALTRAFANHTDAVIAPTFAMRDHLRALGVRVPIAVVASSIDVARFASGRHSNAVRAQLGASGTQTLVLAVSRVAKEKHLELAIDALAHAPQLQLAIVGDGAHRAALEARAQQLGVRARVTFAGTRAAADLPDVYAAADVFAFTSETETQGLVLGRSTGRRTAGGGRRHPGHPRDLGRLRPARAGRSGGAGGRPGGGRRRAARPGGGRRSRSPLRSGAARRIGDRCVSICFTVPYIWHSGAGSCSWITGRTR